MTILVSLVLMSGCAKEQENNTPAQTKQGQLFKEQVQALEKAIGVEQMLENSADQQRQTIGLQSQ